MLYASDSESRNSKGYGYHPGWNRGVRIGSALDGVLAATAKNDELVDKPMS